MWSLISTVASGHGCVEICTWKSILVGNSRASFCKTTETTITLGIPYPTKMFRNFYFTRFFKHKQCVFFLHPFSRSCVGRFFTLRVFFVVFFRGLRWWSWWISPMKMQRRRAALCHLKSHSAQFHPVDYWCCGLARFFSPSFLTRWIAWFFFFWGWVGVGGWVWGGVGRLLEY